MSPRARRLSPTVATDRFAWQSNGVPATPQVVPMMRGFSPSPTSVVPALRDLPSPSVERLEAAEREAFARGYAEGERVGATAATTKVDAVVGRLNDTIEQIAMLRTGIMRRSERDLVRLAVSMAERVLRREVELDRELLVVMARVALDRLGEHSTATIHLNPADYAAVTARRTHDLGKSVELVSDPSVARGGGLVRSSFGTIDVGIDSQIRELSRALLGDEAGDAEERTDGTTADV